MQLSQKRWNKAHPDKMQKYRIAWNNKNIDAVKRIWRATSKRRYDRGREYINRAKLQPCADCNIQYNTWVMDFDHKDPTKKKFTIGASSMKSLVRLQEEILKCDVVCANCHRERTHRNSFKDPYAK